MRFSKIIFAALCGVAAEIPFAVLFSSSWLALTTHKTVNEEIVKGKKGTNYRLKARQIG